MNVAIVGGGLAGLALAWNLLQKEVNVTIFDVGGGASEASTGLMHPFPGKKAALSLQAEEGMRASLELLKKASLREKVYEQTGILRFAVNEEQRRLFQGERLWIPEGAVIYSKLYLKELKFLCKKATIISEKIQSVDELKQFDWAVLAPGSQVTDLVSLDVKKTIGQALLCKCKKKIPYAMLGDGHISPTEDPEMCLVGSTYEHTAVADPRKALSLIDRVASFYPEARDFEVVQILSGIRVSPKVGYKPIVQKMSGNIWTLTGFGSRGLLYHALYARMLCEKLVSL